MGEMTSDDTPTIAYFAYGSNGTAQLQERVACHSLVAQKALLLNHVRIFCGTATRWENGAVSSVASKQGGTCRGSLVYLTPLQLAVLDTFEGIRDGADPTCTDFSVNAYARRQVKVVKVATGEVIDAVTYVRNRHKWVTYPSVAYLTACYKNLVPHWPDLDGHHVLQVHDEEGAIRGTFTSNMIGKGSGDASSEDVPSIPYFSYGSYDRARLEKHLRCPVVIFEKALLLNFTRIFCGASKAWGDAAVSSVVPIRDQTCRGSLVYLTPKQLAAIDACQGIREGVDPMCTDFSVNVYARREAQVVRMSTGAIVDVFIHVRNRHKWVRYPSVEYLTACYNNLATCWPDLDGHHVMHVRDEAGAIQGTFTAAMVKRAALADANVHDTPSVPYFAYGSDGTTQLQERLQCASFEAERAFLLNHVHIFCGSSSAWGNAGVSSVLPQRDGTCRGSLVYLTPKQIDILDRYQGLTEGEDPGSTDFSVNRYARREAKVVVAGTGQVVDAVVYIRNRHTWVTYPTTDYLSACYKSLITMWPELGHQHVIHVKDETGAIRGTFAASQVAAATSTDPEDVPTIPYFAYGSNGTDQLRDRLKCSTLVAEKALLIGYVRIYCGTATKWGNGAVASLISQSDDTCRGSLVYLTPKQLSMLDRFEGIPEGADPSDRDFSVNSYSRRMGKALRVSTGEVVDAIMYIRNRSRWVCYPSARYLTACYNNLIAHWPDLDGNNVLLVRDETGAIQGTFTSDLVTAESRAIDDSMGLESI